MRRFLFVLIVSIPVACSAAFYDALLGRNTNADVAAANAIVATGTLSNKVVSSPTITGTGIMSNAVFTGTLNLGGITFSGTYPWTPSAHTTDATAHGNLPSAIKVSGSEHIKLGGSARTTSLINVMLRATDSGKAFQWTDKDDVLRIHAVFEGAGGVNGIGIFNETYLAFQDSESRVTPQTTFKQTGSGKYFRIYASQYASDGNNLYLQADGDIWLRPMTTGGIVYITTGTLFAPFTGGTSWCGMKSKPWLGVSSSAYYTGSTQVVTSRQAVGAALATGTAGAAYTATEQALLQAAYDRIRTLEAALRTHGLIGD